MRSGSEPIIELARAKINLTLCIRGKRPDGYHELESLVTFADVGDLVTLTPDAKTGVTVAGPFASAILGENLALGALAAVAKAAPGLRSGHIHIDKRLPVASGIGGGSADAAAVLRALRRLNSDRVGEIDWSALARALGADVPACLADRPLIMRGIGERIELLEPSPAATFAVLVTPPLQVPADKTAAVFRALAAPPIPSTIEIHSHLAVETGRNDLEPAAIAVMPDIRHALDALRTTAGVRHVRLSGAGPTCFGLWADAVGAAGAAEQLRGQHPDWWVMPTILG